jgi:hypothetical protein
MKWVSHNQLVPPWTRPPRSRAPARSACRSGATPVTRTPSARCPSSNTSGWWSRLISPDRRFASTTRRLSKGLACPSGQCSSSRSVPT